MCGIGDRGGIWYHKSWNRKQQISEGSEIRLCPFLLFCLFVFFAGGGGYLALPLPSLFHIGSRLCVFFLLQNIAQCCKIRLHPLQGRGGGLKNPAPRRGEGGEGKNARDSWCCVNGLICLFGISVSIFKWLFLTFSFHGRT